VSSIFLLQEGRGKGVVSLSMREEPRDPLATRWTGKKREDATPEKGGSPTGPYFRKKKGRREREHDNFFMS